MNRKRKANKARKKRKLITAASQNITFNRRTLFLGGAQAAVGLLLAGRMTYIAVAENERWEMLSESNRVNLTLIPPRRGWIIDRNGKPLANNRADFRVDLIPDRMKDKEDTIAKLTDLLRLSDDEVGRIKKDLEDSRGFAPIEIASGLDYEQFAALSVRLPDMPGVAPLRGFSRQYPSGAAVGHLLGYVGAVSAEEYEEEKNPLLITPGFKIGKDGLEKQFEQDLRGKPGAKRVEVTARGKIVRELSKREDVPGKPMKLAINADLQEYAARRLGPESGSVVVMDCHTGELLAMSSMPSFDPNSFSDGIGFNEYGMLRDDDHVPLRNKVLKGLYPPGSTVKPMVGLAFLEAGLSPDETVVCNGGLRVGNRRFNCWNRQGHGRVDMAKGIYQSCDVYFYYFAQRIGMDPIAAMARKLGMGQTFDLPVTSQFYGTVPDPEWKRKKYKQSWQAFDTVNATIGQGYMLSNPLQLAVMSSRIASGRNVMPKLLMPKRHKLAPNLDIAPEHLQIIRNAMSDVVNGPGTARRAQLNIPNVKLAGKTGTAQVVGLQFGRGGRDVQWKFRDHGLFVCFAPLDNPRYAASVVIEHGGGSSAAYPVARDVLTFLYDRRKAMRALEALEQSWGGTIEQRMASKMNAYVARKNAEKASQNAPAPETDSAAEANE
ncbi:penicillin-binding protein 2 [Sphingorhabdus sp. Alg239-R122]|uniref:penicillin-binding protein 2 n=1 Tax=Sphingorhabdus sp. Alg239-R122 TaxID=2305989 RepID=UPI0013D952C5|nr:penicillin-binding protein 2 [Sphingorhabdus sp. Alg239-R122]